MCVHTGKTRVTELVLGVGCGWGRPRRARVGLNTAAAAPLTLGVLLAVLGTTDASRHPRCPRLGPSCGQRCVSVCSLRGSSAPVTSVVQKDDIPASRVPAVPGDLCQLAGRRGGVDAGRCTRHREREAPGTVTQEESGPRDRNAVPAEPGERHVRVLTGRAGSASDRGHTRCGGRRDTFPYLSLARGERSSWAKPFPSQRTMLEALDK